AVMHDTHYELSQFLECILCRSLAGKPAALFAASMFFFSSRRRHTRSTRDWSSDVCSSDLGSADGVDHRGGARARDGGRDQRRVAEGVGGVPPGVSGFGLERQRQIFLDGLRGRKPAIPIQPAALEEGARRVMTPEGFAYVAG